MRLVRFFSSVVRVRWRVATREVAWERVYEVVCRARSLRPMSSGEGVDRLRVVDKDARLSSEA